MGLIVYELVELSFKKSTEYEQVDQAAFMVERGWKITREGDTVRFEHVGTTKQEPTGKQVDGKPEMRTVTAIQATGEKFEAPWAMCRFGVVAK